jgi:hypothetical protein
MPMLDFSPNSPKWEGHFSQRKRSSRVWMLRRQVNYGTRYKKWFYVCFSKERSHTDFSGFSFQTRYDVLRLEFKPIYMRRSFARKLMIYFKAQEDRGVCRHHDYELVRELDA